MGYHTEFDGRFELNRPLSDEHFAYLIKFSDTRRMLRDERIAASLPDPVRDRAGLPIGIEGSYFVGGAGVAGQDKDVSVLDPNRPPSGQPGLWCQWAPTSDRQGIDANDCDSFYNYADWLTYLLENFLKPWNYQISGSVRYQGDEYDDQGIIYISDNSVRVLPIHVGDGDHYSCFVSYGDPDVKFAEKLVEDLEAIGIRCWLYKLDATVGARSWYEIGKRRRESERVLFLCSSNALVRDGFLKEIEEQIDEDPDKIVPLSLDDLWKHAGFRVERGRDLKPFLLDRNYADFVKLKYEEALERLVRGLKKVGR